MKLKQYIAIGAIVVGILLIGFSVSAKSKVLHAKEGMEKVSGILPNNQAGSEVRNIMHSKLSQYDMMIRLCLIGGIIIGIAGVFGVYYFRKHR